MIKTMTDLDDFVRGSTLFGTGGGGPQVMGRKLLMGSFQEGKDISWIDIDELKDDDWICTAFYMGSIAPLTEQDKENMELLGLKERVEPRVLVRAVKELEKELGITFAAIVPVELGGINSPAPVDAAAQMGKKVLDADLAGRAVPEVAQTLPRIKGLPIAPLTCCDAWGNVVLIRETHGYDFAEQLGKMVSIPAYEPIGMACFAMQVKDAKNAIVKGTMSRNLEAGRVVREAREAGRDPAEAFAKVADGRVVFRGTVSKKEWESKGGYMFVNLFINGKDKFEGHEMKIWAKNENHMSWLDGRPYIMSPDLIQCVYEEGGDPVTNTDIKEGDKVAVVAIAHPLYRSPEGLKILGPIHYGFKDIPYQRMEDQI